MTESVETFLNLINWWSIVDKYIQAMVMTNEKLLTDK